MQEVGDGMGVAMNKQLDHVGSRHDFGRIRSIHILLFSMCCLVGSGCSSTPSLVPAKGVVRLDGKPIENVFVCFWALEPGDPSRTGYGLGITDAQGNVVVKDLFGKEGIFPGKYKVTFSLYVNAQGEPIAVNAKARDVYGGARDIMPKKYQKQETTDVLVEVPSKGLEQAFELSSK
jgi:hypothetical protein